MKAVSFPNQTCVETTRVRAGGKTEKISDLRKIVRGRKDAQAKHLTIQ